MPTFTEPPPPPEGPFEGLRAALQALVGQFASPAPRPPVAPAKIGAAGGAFADDVVLPDGRVGLRVRLSDGADGRWVADLRDSDPLAPRTSALALDPAGARAAVASAFAHALGIAGAPPHPLELLIDPSSVAGGGLALTRADPAGYAFALARTVDAVLGALAQCWPAQVGAGSTSLGALVALAPDGGPWVLEVLPGGEGAQPGRAGCDAPFPSEPTGVPPHASLQPVEAPWLVLPPRWLSPAEQRTIPGLRVDATAHAGSGGGGARSGGAGIVRGYELERDAPPCWIALRVDRISNPPHGLLRAGPPAPAHVRRLLLDHEAARGPGPHVARGEARPLEPAPWLRDPADLDPAALAWTTLRLEPGQRVEVFTAGGAGHGFGGWGVDWDERELFGAAPDDAATLS
jgi:hypothetical protein